MLLKCSKANVSIAQLKPHASYATLLSETPWWGGLRITTLVAGGASMFTLNSTQRGTLSLGKKSNSRLKSSLNTWSKKSHPLFSLPASSYLPGTSPPCSLHSKTSNLSGRKAHKSWDSFAAELVLK